MIEDINAHVPAITADAVDEKKKDPSSSMVLGLPLGDKAVELFSSITTKVYRFQGRQQFGMNRESVSKYYNLDSLA